MCSIVEIDVICFSQSLKEQNNLYIHTTLYIYFYIYIVLKLIILIFNFSTFMNVKRYLICEKNEMENLALPKCGTGYF